MKKPTSRFSVLIPDGERRQLESVVYCLSKIAGVRIYVMSNKTDDPLRFSRYIHRYTYYPDAADDNEWMLNLNKELANHKIDIILPVFEERIRTLIKHKEQLREASRLVEFPSLINYDTANNKGLLATHLKMNSLPGPNSVFVAPGTYTQVDTSSLSYPLLAKPTEMTDSGMGIHLFKSKEELDHFFVQENTDLPYLLQNFIEGYDLGCNVLCNRGEVLAYTIQKGNLYDGNPYSPQVGLDFLYLDEVLTLVKTLMKSLNWSGVANIDLMYDENRKEYNILEINPRYWATLDASLASGVNFPYLQCLNRLGEKFEIPSYKHLEYLNLYGLMIRIKRNKSTLLRFSFLWHNSPLKYIAKDPLPMTYRFFRRAKKILIRKK